MGEEGAGVAGIFISYRRDDTAPWAGRLYERLARDFPRDQLLMDVDAIEPGLDFVEVLDEHVAGCDALIVIIGPNWTDVRKKDGLRRLDDPDDFVRIEVGSALKRAVRVIPVLVDGAPMPRADELPEPLKPLARRNALEVSHARFGSDTQGLVEVLQRLVQPARVGRAKEARKSSPPQSGTIGGQWGWFLAVGMLLVIAGVISITFPLVHIFSISTILVWVFLASGTLLLIHALSNLQWRSFVMGLLLGLLYIMVGGGILLTGSLYLLLPPLLAVTGVLEVITAVRVRPHEKWGWWLTSGLIAVAVSVLFGLQLPSSAEWATGLLVGVNLLSTGLSFVVLALGRRRAQ